MNVQQATRLEFHNPVMETHQVQRKCFHGFEVSAAPPTKKSFHFERTLGSGTCGKVYQAKCQNGCEIAIKEVEVDSELLQSFSKRELKCLFLLKNNPKKNLIYFFGFFDEGRHRYLAFEKGGDNLRDLISRKIQSLKLEDFNEISHQLFEAALQLHQLRIEHVDCKFENMVFFEKEKIIKLIDFEKSCTVEGNRLSNTTRILPIISSALIELQLKILHKNNDEEYEKIRYKLIAHACDDDCDEKMLKLQSDQDIWLADIPDATRDFLIKCFSKDKKILEELLTRLETGLPEDLQPPSSKKAKVKSPNLPVKKEQLPFYPRSNLDVFVE